MRQRHVRLGMGAAFPTLDENDALRVIEILMGAVSDTSWLTARARDHFVRSL